MKRIYLSGPISGLEREDYMRRFATAERVLCEQGFDVCNPTRFLVCRWPWLYRIVGYRMTLCYDLWRMMHCTHIFMLPMSYTSTGATIEQMAASYMGIHSLTFEENRRAYQAVKELIR